MQRSGRAPAKNQLALRYVAGELAIAESIAIRFHRSGIASWVLRFQPCVEFGNALQRFGRIDIAGDAEDGVSGSIEIAIEAVHQLAGEGAQAGLTSDAPP